MSDESSSMGIIGEASANLQIHIDEEKIKEVDEVFDRYAPILKPNRKLVSEIISYIKGKYPTEEGDHNRIRDIVIENVLANFDQVNESSELEVVVINIKNEGTAELLYKNQELEHKAVVSKMKSAFKDYEEHPFKYMQISIWAEIKTDYLSFHGSQLLADEITICRGLDDIELKNRFLVANYVKTMQRYNLIE